jgi:hypothetical protein
LTVFLYFPFLVAPYVTIYINYCRTSNVWKVPLCPRSYDTSVYIHTCTMYLSLTRARVAQWVRWLDYLTTYTSLSPIWRGFAPGFVNYKKGCTRLATASDKVYQLLVHGRWFSPSTPASFTTKTGRHDIAEILPKVALKHQKSINLSLALGIRFPLVASCTWYNFMGFFHLHSWNIARYGITRLYSQPHGIHASE